MEPNVFGDGVSQVDHEWRLPSLLNASPALHHGANPEKPERCPSSWELELRRVHADLKEKLENPHFVATRCDQDGSGDLSFHELQQALRVFGRSFQGPELQELMLGQTWISKERFAEIIEASHPSRRRIVPHSLRGMALGQLHHLETLFVTSGWLAMQCNSFNTVNSQAILDGKMFYQAPNLYGLDMFVVTPMSKPGHCMARDQDHQQSIPASTEPASFSELLNPHGLYVHCFVSHFWGHDFHSTVKALEMWAGTKLRALETEDPEAVVFWICLFALNQHNVAEEVGKTPRQGPFNAALSQATGGAVMVLDAQINPFRRIWCLFEISRLKDLERPFELISDMGSLSQPESFQWEAEAIVMLRATCEALWEVSAMRAQSSVEADKYAIWAETVSNGLKGAIEAHGAKAFFDAEIQASGLDGLNCFFGNFDHYVRSLLSSSVLQLSLARADYASAAKCCLHGASFTREQLQEICTSFSADGQRTVWLTELLSKATDATMAQLLLQCGADVAARVRNGETALLGAARGGQVAVVRMLLQHGADAGATRHDGATALMCAATAGYEHVAKLLLLHRANAGAKRNDGLTALLCAATVGHEHVAKLLLHHGANAAAARNDGFTPLMFAAKCGHEPVVRLLLHHGVDVGATRGDGATALMDATQGGHEAVIRLLLQHGADKGAARSLGCDKAELERCIEFHMELPSFSHFVINM